MRIADSFRGTLVIEVQSGKMTGIGVVTETDIHGIRAMIDRGLQGGQITCRTYEFHLLTPGSWSYYGEAGMNPGAACATHW
jgi:hypothetical protein